MNGAFRLSELLQGTAAPAPQWFDKQTLFTAAGATTAVITVTAVVQRTFPKIPPRWFAFGLSLLIALFAIPVQGLDWSVVNVVVAVVNGIMTYAAAVGINTVVTTTPTAAAHSYRWWT
jgi:hypothetical protein